MEPKKPSESYTESVQILNRSTMNGYDRLFGGKLMEWIDVIAAVVARRHSKKNVTTVLVNRLEFKKPAFANDLVVLTGKIVCVDGHLREELCRKGGRDEDAYKPRLSDACSDRRKRKTDTRPAAYARDRRGKGRIRKGYGETRRHQSRERELTTPDNISEGFFNAGRKQK